MNNKSTKYYSNKQEKSVAKAIKGKVQIASGATPFFKGDVETSKCLIECKTSMTEKKSYLVKRDILDKIEEQAFSMNKLYPVLAFNFGEDTPNYYILNERTFKYFIDLLNSVDED